MTITQRLSSLTQKPHAIAIASKTVIAVLLACLSLPSSAQSPFTQLNWQEMQIDSILPTYTEVVPLETDYRQCNYRVELTYPEWEKLTDTEAKVAERFRELLADTIQVRSHVGVSRKRGLLDISFIPIIYKDGYYQKLTSCKISIIPSLKPQIARRRIARRAEEQSEASTTPRWAESSVLAEGRWVKISVTDDGIHFLSHSALTSMGFSDPANIRVYGYGGHLLSEVFDEETHWDDLQPVALQAVEGGYLFFANGLTSWNAGRHTVNHYARTACYFITDGQPDNIQQADASDALAAKDTVTTFVAGVVYDPDEYAWFQGGRQLFEDYDYANGNSRSYTLALPTSATGDEAKLRIAFTAANSTSTAVTPTYNGLALSNMNCSRLADYEYAVQSTKTFTVPVPQASNIIRITTDAGQHARLNFIELAYTGLMRLDEKTQSFSFTHSTEGAPELVRIEYSNGQEPCLWRLAEPNSAAEVLAGTKRDSTDASGNIHHLLEVVLPADSIQHRYVAFNQNYAASFAQPSYIETVANQNLHADSLIDMIIIIPSSGIFDAQAARLAELHEAWDGLRVKVVHADEIYNEFSSGTPDATAYRWYLKMLYDRASSNDDAPRYLLLFGDAAWDNRMLSSAWRNYDPKNFLLAYESDNSLSDTQCYIMEDYFGMLDDGEGETLAEDKTDVGVGRFPVRTVVEAKAVVDKTIAYVQGAQAGAWKNVVTFLGDDGDSNEHLRYTDDVANIVSGLFPQLEVRKIMWDAYKRVSSSSGNRYPQVEQIINNQMDEGALMMNYTGHASTYCLSHEQVMRIENFAQYSSPRPPLWVTAGCDVMPFDTQKDNIGETAVLNANGAAIAFFGTSRTVYAYNNLFMNRAFCRAVFATDEQGRSNRLGDAVRISKVTVIDSGTDGIHPQNKLHYALLGDPALRLGSVSNRIVVDSINGIAVDELPTDFTVHAGGRVRFSGHLSNFSGDMLSDFNGILSTRLYDSQSEITCYNNENNSRITPFQFKTYDKILYNGTDSIQNGLFSITCPIPIDMSYSNENGRLLLYAISNDRKTEANGYEEKFNLGGTESGLTDVNGPEIEAWLGKEDFEDGGTVGATPYFVAKLHDESGINTSGSSLGHDLELIIDNNPSTTYNLNDYFTNEFGDYSRGTAAFSIPALPEGEHKLLFRAWDMLNNESSITMSFIVDSSLKTSILNLSATNSPASTYTQFLINYDRPGSLCHFTIEVFDFTGRLLWSKSIDGSNQNGIYAIDWDLTSSGGKALGSGIYLYRVRVSCDDAEETSESRKIVINRRQ